MVKSEEELHLSITLDDPVQPSEESRGLSRYTYVISYLSNQLYHVLRSLASLFLELQHVLHQVDLACRYVVVCLHVCVDHPDSRAPGLLVGACGRRARAAGSLGSTAWTGASRRLHAGRCHLVLGVIYRLLITASCIGHKRVWLTSTESGCPIDGVPCEHRVHFVQVLRQTVPEFLPV